MLDCPKMTTVLEIQEKGQFFKKVFTQMGTGWPKTVPDAGCKILNALVP